jgi:hypothetical protein
VSEAHIVPSRPPGFFDHFFTSVFCDFGPALAFRPWVTLFLSH